MEFEPLCSISVALLEFRPLYFSRGISHRRKGEFIVQKKLVRLQMKVKDSEWTLLSIDDGGSGTERAGF